jgi:hypothetical protein
VQAKISGMGLGRGRHTWINMQKHITREIEGSIDAQLADDAISSVAENSAAEYVRQIARGEGPPGRQQFSLGNQLSWNPARALPQFLFQGKPILLTDPEQVARWARAAHPEAEEDAPGRMAQLFKVQSKPAPRDISLELEKSAAGKIVFQSADRPGWDKVIYYHAGEKKTAERLAEILRNSRELTDQQQAEVWRLEGWPETDIARELERIRNVQQMHDESWWTPQPSLMDRARQRAKNLLSFGRGKEASETARTPAKAEPQQTRRLLGEIQRSPERIARLPRSEPLTIEGLTVAEPIGGKADTPPPESVLDAPSIAGFHQTEMRAAMGHDLNRTRTNGGAKISSGLSRQDEPVYRWLEAAMEDVHRHSQSQRRTLKGKRPSAP